MVQRCFDGFQDAKKVDIVPDWEVLCRSLRYQGERHIAEQQILVTQFFQDMPEFLHDPDRLSECDVPPDGCPDIPSAIAPGLLSANAHSTVRAHNDLASENSSPCHAPFLPAYPDAAVCQGDAVNFEQESEKNEGDGHRAYLSKASMKEMDMDPESNFFIEALRVRAHKHGLARRFLSCADWLMSVKEPVRSGYLLQFVHGYLFSTLTLAAIILNSVFTIYATNRTIQLSTDTLTPAMQVVEACFLGFYCLELTLKLAVHGLYFFVNAECRWNIFDFLLVTFAIVDQLIMKAADMDNLDLTFMRTLRLMKISKVLRMFRAMRFFAELRLMLDCVAGSVLSLFWCFVTLGLFKLIFALVFTQSVAQLLLSGQELAPTTRQKLLQRWGSVQDATLTLFQATSGGSDWEEAFDLVRLCGPIPSTLFIFYIVFEVFAAVNIVTSMFVDKAMKLAQPDMEMMLMEKRRSDMKHAHAIMEVCREADSNHSGSISYKEFEELMNDARIRSMFELKGLDIKDAELFFRMLAGVEGSNEVDLHTFVAGCMKIKGVAMSVDLMSVSFELKMLTRREGKLRKALTERLDEVFELVKGIAPGSACAHDSHL